MDYRIVSATKPGDNFASIALRVNANYQSHGQDKTKSCIVKVEPYEDGFKKDVLSDTLLFETEIAMYTKTIPEMQRLIKEIYPTEIIAPACSYNSLKPHKIIFIDDISPEFVMSPGPVDYDVAERVFHKIATFHALSFYMGEDHEPMKNYREGFISKSTEKMMPMFMMLYSQFVETISEWGPEMELVAQKLTALQPNFYPKLLKIFSTNDVTGYNVLNHGDFHIKNIMFRNQEEFPKDHDQVRLVSLQMVQRPLAMKLYNEINN